MLTQAFAKLHALRRQSEILFSKWMETEHARASIPTTNVTEETRARMLHTYVFCTNVNDNDNDNVYSKERIYIHYIQKKNIQNI